MPAISFEAQRRNLILIEARRRKVSEKGINILLNIEILLAKWYEAGREIADQAVQLFQEFERLHPGIMSQLEAMKNRYFLPHCRPGRKRLDRLDHAFKLHEAGLSLDEICRRMIGPDVWTALGFQSRRKMRKYYQKAISKRRCKNSLNLIHKRGQEKRTTLTRRKWRQ